MTTKDSAAMSSLTEKLRAANEAAALRRVTAAWDWIKAQLIDLALIGLFLFGFVSLIKGGKVAGMLVASAAIAVWLGAVLVAQMKVVEVGRESGRGVEGHAKPSATQLQGYGSVGTIRPINRPGAAGIKPGRPLSVPVLPSDSRASASGPVATGSMATSPPGGVAGPFNPRASLSAKAADARLSVAEDGTGRER